MSYAMLRVLLASSTVVPFSSSSYRYGSIAAATSASRAGTAFSKQRMASGRPLRVRSSLRRSSAACGNLSSSSGSL